MSSGLGNQEVARPCSEPEAFPGAGAEQKAKHNGLDREWVMRKPARVDGSPGVWSQPCGRGDGTVIANPAGRFYLKAHTPLCSQAYVQSGLSVQTLEPDSWGSSPRFALGCVISVCRL